jgi:hypothetical protein
MRDPGRYGTIINDNLSFHEDANLYMDEGMEDQSGM